MADPDRTMRTAVDIEDVLHEEAAAFDFFHALRLIETAYPDQPRIGESLHPRSDPVRFGQDPYMIFAPTAIAGFERRTGQRLPRLVTYFFGLFGPNGPLPQHLTEYARDRLLRRNDPTMVAFLDMFHHRLISLFYRAWAAAQPVVHLDRPRLSPFSRYIASFAGLGMPSLSERDALHDHAKLHYAGRLTGQRRTAQGLEAILREFFRLPVDVYQFAGAWLDLPASGWTRLGRLEGGAATLGVTTIVGRRVWDRQHKIRISLGPLDLVDYRRFLPGGESLARLIAWVRLYAGEGVHWDVRLKLLKGETRRPRAGGELKLGRGMQLGWTTWLGSDIPSEDPSGLVLEPLALNLQRD